MPVIYNNCALIPAPLVNIQDEPILAGNQTRIGNIYRLTINGTIASDMGSPQAGSLGGAGWGGFNNLFWVTSNYPPSENILLGHKLYAVETKQQAIKTLFATEGQWLEFYSPDGSAPLKCQIKNVIVSFPEGIWVQTCPYTITCETDVLYLNGQIFQGLSFPELIQTANESWDVAEADVIKTYRVSHQVSAVGKKTFDILGNPGPNAWEVAKQFVNQRLTVGWQGTSTFSSTNGPYIFNNSSLASGVISFSGLSPYNFARTEAIDELAGSYAVTETWTLAKGSGTDVYNVNVNQIVNEPYETTRVEIQGVIRGFYTDLFDYDQRNKGAAWVWSQLSGAPLLARAQSYVSGALFRLPTAATLVYNPFEGSITYNYQFTNKAFTGDALETYKIAKQVSAEDYKTHFTIEGNIVGNRYSTDTDVTLPFQRALTLWNIVGSGNTLYNRVLLSKYFPEASGLGLQVAPLVKNVTKDESLGTISYSYEFDNRQNDSGVWDNMVVEEYALSRNFSRDQGRITYNINGVIRGLNIIESSDTRGAKWANASGYWYIVAKPNLYNRVSTYFQTQLSNTIPQVEETEENPTLGTINYSFQFWNIPAPIISGALSEIITVAEQNSKGNVQTIADIPIPGKSSGPILQDIRTTPSKLRTLSIETVMYPTGGVDFLAAWNLRPDYDSYIDPLTPVNGYRINDNYTWNWREGRYSRQVEWKYI